jgi:hypothetical protein
MNISPYYILLGVGIGLVAIFVLRNLSLALRLAVALGKVAGIAFLVLLAGSVLGLWRLPRPLAVFLFGLRRLWQPVQRTVLSWFGGLTP